jgi:hypothetical protein
MTALPTRCPVRGCGTWTDATEHWPFCDTHYWTLPPWRRDDVQTHIDLCYQSGGDASDEAALLRSIGEATAALYYLGLVDAP